MRINGDERQVMVAQEIIKGFLADAADLIRRAEMWAAQGGIPDWNNPSIEAAKKTADMAAEMIASHTEAAEIIKRADGLTYAKLLNAAAAIDYVNNRQKKQ